MAKLKIELEELKDLHDSGVMSTEVWNAAVMEAIRKDREFSDGTMVGAAAVAGPGGAREEVKIIGIQASAPPAPSESVAPPPYFQSVATDERSPLLSSEPPPAQPIVTRQPTSQGCAPVQRPVSPQVAPRQQYMLPVNKNCCGLTGLSVKGFCLRSLVCTIWTPIIITWNVLCCGLPMFGGCNNPPGWCGPSFKEASHCQCCVFMLRIPAAN